MVVGYGITPWVVKTNNASFRSGILLNSGTFNDIDVTGNTNIGGTRIYVNQQDLLDSINAATASGGILDDGNYYLVPQPSDASVGSLPNGSSRIVDFLYTPGGTILQNYIDIADGVLENIDPDYDYLLYRFSTIATQSASVGIGTTNPTSKLSVFGDAYITGIVTAVGGFISVGNTTPVTINVSNNKIIFNYYIDQALLFKPEALSFLK